MREIKKQNPLFGTYEKLKRATKKSRVTSVDESLDTSRPHLFSDRPKEKKAPLAKQIKPIANPVQKDKSSRKVKASKKHGNDLLLSVLKRTTK